MKRITSFILLCLFTISVFADFSYKPYRYQTCSDGVKGGWQDCGATIIYTKNSGLTSSIGNSLSTLVVYTNKGDVLWFCSWYVNNSFNRSTGRDTDGAYWERYSVEAYENMIGIPIHISLYYYPNTKQYYVELYQNSREWAVFSGAGDFNW